jgi:AcrR family transcriptional regulator
LSTAKRRPLTPDRVLRAALRLVDKHGLDALSMRKLAQELGVEAMSLYNHVENKDDILRGIIELVVAEIDLAEDENDWQRAMRRRVLSAHETLARHPWAPALWMRRGGGRGGARMRYADAVLRGLREAGFSPELTYHAFHVLQSHVLGFALQERNLQFDTRDLEKRAARFLERFPAGEYPDLAEHVKQHLEPHDAQRGTFEFGLDLILDSLERLRVSA